MTEANEKRLEELEKEAKEIDLAGGDSRHLQEELKRLRKVKAHYEGK